LSNLINKLKLDIVVLMETWLKGNSLLIENYQAFLFPPNSHQGVAVLLKKDRFSRYSPFMEEFHTETTIAVVATMTESQCPITTVGHYR
jgi:hypothetical protein